MVCHRQHLNILVGLCRGVLDVPLAIVRPFVLYSELHHHFQDNKDILHRLNAETAIEFLQNELLHKFLTQSLTIASSLLFCFFSAILKDYRFFVPLQPKHQEQFNLHINRGLSRLQMTMWS